MEPIVVSVAEVEPLVVSVAHAAVMLNLSEMQVRRLIERGDLAHTRLDRRVCVPVDALRQYVKGLTSTDFESHRYQRRSAEESVPA